MPHATSGEPKSALTDVRRAVVHENVHRAETLLGFLDQVFKLLVAPNVTGDGHNLARQRRELLRRRFKVLLRATGNNHVRARLGEPARDVLADAAPAAGDDGHFVSQTNGCAHVA